MTLDKETHELCGFCDGGWKQFIDATGFHHFIKCGHCGGTGLQLTPEEWWRAVGR
jgi:hypothetical protein